ncbi:dTMP kinase [Lacticigenium naphthae]|uniref:dTMP kinase n=1 Tax=Lacticigenium naphthae TaxID=515351 RepID=UPI00041C2AC9|nr:dTMP kinase [Lacticigenium naphthae]
MKGIFITFEGPDGSGKTSVIREIVRRLEEQQDSVISTREPGGNRIAEMIRELILDPQNTDMDERTEALLYAASRRQHLKETILPALTRGNIVICDRFVDSSVVYQGYARGIGMEEVAQMNQFATESLSPDLTLYLDVEAEIGLQRINQGKEKRQYDRLDREALSFHQLVRSGYLKVVAKNTDRIVTVDASAELEKVVESSWQIIQKFIQRRTN